MSELTLIIGNKNYSSWSMRPWLALKHAGAVFKEVLIPLYQPGAKTQILEYSSSGKVPVLHHGSVVVWESLAICEYVAELFPAAGLWPGDPAARAHARSIAGEMHAGFAELRRNMPMDLRQRKPGEGRTAAVDGDIARIAAIWQDTRARFGAGGPFLFGSFTNADAMFAPVCTRFATYEVALAPVCRAYVDAVLDLEMVRAWYAAGTAEPWYLP
ncbi:MAG: glutathione S-transferase [Azospirillum sp.]|nr:glutathione S-transferase [Azospirillum sp.]